MKFLLPLIVSTLLSSCGSSEPKTAAPESGKDSLAATSTTAETWNWPDSLDALTASPSSHKLIYEDSAVRILQVVCAPGTQEPIHTHRYRSTMWFTQSSHLAFSNYSRGANKELVKSDSAEVPGFPAEIMNKGQMVEPEGPHSIKNLGKDSFVAYRVEYKRAL